MNARGAVDSWLFAAAQAAVIGAIASPLVVVDGAYFPYTVGRAIAFDRMAELALIAWLTLLARGRIEFRASAPTLMILAFALWIVATALTGAHPVRSFASTMERSEGALTWLRAALLLLVAENVFVGIRGRRHLLVGVVVAGGAIAVSGMPAVPAAWPFRGPAFGNGGLLAGFLIGVLPLAALLCVDRAARLPMRALGAMVACVTVAAIALVANRAGLAGIVLGTVAAAAMLQPFRRLALLGLGLAILALPIVLATSDPRGVAWQAALAGILDRLLLGWGVENFNLPFDLYRRGAAQEPFFDRAHNAILDAAIAGGIVASALHLAPAIRALQGLQSVLGARAAIVAGGVIAKLGFGMFWFDQPITLVLAGLLFAETAPPLRLTPGMPPPAWRAPLAIATCAALGLAWHSVDMLRHARVIGTAVAEHAARGGVPTLPVPQGIAYALRQDVRLLAGDWMLRAMVDTGRRPDDMALAAVITGLEDFSAEAPLDCRAPLLAALLLDAAGDAEAAAPLRARAIALAPSHPALHRPDRVAAHR